MPRQYTARLAVVNSDPILRQFEATRARRPDAPLVVSAAASWSAEELGRAARGLAEELSASGFGAGDVVGLAAPAPAFVAGYLALRAVAAIPVLCDGVRPTPDRLGALDRLGAVGFLACASGWPGAASAWQIHRRRPDRTLPCDPAWGAIKLTSGSTGEPRGIAVGSEALLADDAQLAAAMGLSADDRLVAAVPLSHSYGFSSLLLPTLVRGSLLVVPEEGSALAPLAAARRHQATFLPTVPAWLGAYSRLGEPPPWPESLARVVSAGAPLPPATAVAFRERTGREVRVFYGASECGGIAYDRSGGAAERGTVGTPVPGVEVEVDPQTGRLSVRSPAVAATYLPEAAAELGGGRFLTGDRAVLEAGELRLLGRADDVVIVRGRNVDPREVERAIAAVPGVEEVCVLGIDGPDGPRSVLRAVVAAPEGGVDARAVTEACRRELAAYKIPRSVVVVAELPRTERGKVDRAAAAALGERSALLH